MIDERRAKQIKAMSSQQAINALAQGDFDSANQALYDGNKKLINLRYDGIADWDKLEKLIIKVSLRCLNITALHIDLMDTEAVIFLLRKSNDFK